MPRRFRVTCARTSYVDIDIEAEDSASAERLIAAALREDDGILDQGLPVGRPIHRIVMVAAAAEASGGLEAEAA